MQKARKLILLIMITVLICTLSIPAFAHEVPDVNRKGSISVTLLDGTTAVSGGSLTLYKVGNVKEDNGNYTFEIADEYKASGVTFENLGTEQAVQDLAEYAKKNSTQWMTEKVDKYGKAVFSDLEIGLYLIVQEEAANGYMPVNPFFVTVPMVEGEGYVYDVDASPKVVPPEKAPETTTQVDTEETTGKVEETTEPEETTKPEETTEKTEETTKQPTKPSLPVTGQLNWPIPVLVIFGLALIFVGWTLKYSKKGNQQI